LGKSRAVADALNKPSAIPAQRARSAGPTRRATPRAWCSRRCRAARCTPTRASSRRSASQRQLVDDHLLGSPSLQGERKTSGAASGAVVRVGASRPSRCESRRRGTRRARCGTTSSQRLSHSSVAGQRCVTGTFKPWQQGVQHRRLHRMIDVCQKQTLAKALSPRRGLGDCHEETLGTRTCLRV
jgi:hypothetical protein